MYFTSLPDHTQRGFDEKLHFSRFKKHNLIFHAQSNRSQCDRHVGCLSFKTVLSGEEWYGINQRRLAIRPGQFLVLNDDQSYSCRIDHENVKVLSVFFKKEFASSVFRDIRCNEDELLNDPNDSGARPPEFFQTLHDITPELHYQLSSLITVTSEGYTASRVEEYLIFLLQTLIQVHKTGVKHALRIDALKASTRTEIYRRLCIAKDVLHSSYMDNPDLEEISRSACLSVPQLVRHFRSAFLATPHQYLIRIRLRQAAALLKSSDMPVHEITWRCGFENVSAFCRAFKLVYGVQPLQFRKNTHQ
jgi:AraC family transcriptional regulator